VGRTRKIRTDDLYGEYDGLSEKEIEFIKLVTNPENKLKGLTEQEIADTLGLGLKTPHNYRQKPKIREAIYRETMLKAADEVPSMMLELRKLCEQTQDRKAQISALTLWFKINGVISEAKESNIDKNSKLRSSVEESLINLADENRTNFKEFTG